MLSRIRIDVLIQIIGFVTLLIMPPWFALADQFRERFSKSVIGLLSVVYLSLSVFLLFTEPYMQTLIPFIAVLITLYIRRRKRDVGEDDYYLRSLKGRKGRIIGYSLLFKLFTVIITTYFIAELTKYGFDITEQAISTELMESDWLTTILLVIMAGVFAPILEEFVFRHLFYRKFAKKIGPVLSAVITSLMFSALHFNLASSAATFSVGLFNCYLYEREGYRAAVLSHFVFNSTSLALALLLRVFNFI